MLYALWNTDEGDKDNVTNESFAHFYVEVYVVAFINSLYVHKEFSKYNS